MIREVAMNKVKIIPLTTKEIFNLYVNEEYTLPQLASRCNCCTNIIRDRLHAMGLNTKEKRAYKAYDMNDTCLSDLDENTAYILGYFYDRAVIDEKLNTIRVQVDKKDENILEKICDIVFGIDTKYFISKKDGKQKLLIINNNKVKNDYVKLKDRIIMDLSNINENLKRNFFRGYLESNSKIKFSLNKQRYNLILDGEERIINIMQDILYVKYKNKKYPLCRVEFKNGNVFYRYKTNKYEDILRIYDCLYKEDDKIFSDKHIEVFKDIFYNKLTTK